MAAPFTLPDGEWEGVLESIQRVGSSEEFMKTIKEAAKMGGKLGVCATAGALLGPVGFIAGAIGGGIWALATRKQYRTIVELVRDMSNEERRALAHSCIYIATQLFQIAATQGAFQQLTDAQIGAVIRESGVPIG